MTSIITSIIIGILLALAQTTCPAGFTPYVITQVDSHEKYVTVYGIDSHGEYGCVLDDVTEDWQEPWMITIGQVVYVERTDGIITDVINPDEYIRYTVTEAVENQVPGYEPYYTIYAKSPSGQVECILDDEPEEWTAMIGKPVLVRYGDQGYVTDIRCIVQP